MFRTTVPLQDHFRVQHTVGQIEKAALLVTILAVPLIAQKPAAAATPWVVTFDEEFDGAELSLPKWAPHDPEGHERNREAQAWVPDAIEVKDGIAHITARRAHARYDSRDREFTSGVMTTRGSFAQMYGRFEIRCRLPAGKGFEPKFWLLPVPSGDLPSIDILDAVGSEPDKAMFANRWGDEKTERSYSGSYRTGDLSTEFIRLRSNGTPARYVWSVDGNERFRSVEGVPHQPMYLAVGLSVGGVVAKYPDEKTPFPASFDIDYIRVYRQP